MDPKQPSQAQWFRVHLPGRYSRNTYFSGLAILLFYRHGPPWRHPIPYRW